MTNVNKKATQEMTSVTYENDTDRFMRPNEVAELIGMKVITLARWRAAGKGPKFYRIHGEEHEPKEHQRQPVRYRRGDVLHWMKTGEPEEPRKNANK